MIYDPSVTVLHAHGLGLGSFHGQHFSYGRGAFPFWRKGAKSGSSFRIEPFSFYKEMLRAPFQAGVPSAAMIATLTLTAQLANAAGFFYEMARTLLQRRSASFVDDTILHDERYPLRNVNVL